MPAERTTGLTYRVWLTERDFVEPDLLYLAPQSAGKVEAPFVRGGPDLVVEMAPLAELVALA